MKPVGLGAKRVRTEVTAAGFAGNRAFSRSASTLRRSVEVWLPTRVERGRHCRIERLVGELHAAGRVTMRPEARHTARFRFVRIDRKRIVVAAAGARDVIGAAAQRARRAGVDEIEHERRLHADRRMQRRGWMPRPEAHTGDEFAGYSG